MYGDQPTDDHDTAGVRYERPTLTEIGSFQEHTRGINGTTWEPQPLTWTGP
jgi:hypothetical protein